MCFSAEVSFAASAGLLAIGTKTIIENSKKTRLFSYIPIIFSLHQFAEGMNWVLFSEVESFWKIFFTRLYAYIEYTFWPVFIPLAIYFMEPSKEKLRRKFQACLVVLGVGYSLYWGSYMIQGEVAIHKFCNPGCGGLAYLINFPPYTSVLRYLYLFTIAAPALISSFRSVKVFGLLLCITWIASNIFFFKAFGSTWCFFAAILSCFLYLGIKEQRRSVEDETSKFN